MISDLSIFVDIFSKPIAHSTPHIYLCALLFSPLNSLPRRTLRIIRQPQLVCHQTGSWDALRLPLPSPSGIPSDRTIRGFKFSPDGLQITCVCNDGMLRDWNIQTGEVNTTLLDGVDWSWPYGVDFSTDQTQIVANLQDFALQLWDTQSGVRIGPPLKGHKSAIYSLAFSPDASVIASGSDDGEIRLWNALSFTAIERPRWGHDRWPVSSLAFSPDATLVVSGCWDSMVCVWDASSGLQVGNAFNHPGQVYCVVYSPDGKQIASASDDHAVMIWDSATGNPCFGALRHIDIVRNVTYIPSGQHIASAVRGSIHLWDSATGDHIAHLNIRHELISEIAYSSDSRRLSCRSGSQIRVWELDGKGSSLKDPNGISIIDHTSRSSIWNFRAKKDRSTKVEMIDPVLILNK